MDDRAKKLRSAEWFAGFDIQSFCHRAWLRQTGFSHEAMDARPVVGVCNMWSELVGCNVHLRGLAEAVKRGVFQAGGVPFEFPVLAPGDALQKPAAMMYRNLASMDVEEMIRSNPIDAVVLLAGCDKSVPASLMGALSADVPFVLVASGPALPGFWRGRRLGSGAGYWGFAEQARLGELTNEEYLEAEASLNRSHGTCMDMGTASTMACLAEGLGVSLPGCGTIPAVDARRAVLAERSGRRAVELAWEGRRPSEWLRRSSFTNAIHLLQALGGSTNAVIHLTAMAGRLGISLTLDDYNSTSATPVLANIEPSGSYLMEDFFNAGGVQALIRELLPLLDADAETVSGNTVGEIATRAETYIGDVVRPLSNPVFPQSAHTVLRGSLAPDGALLKRSAASDRLLHHRGKAVVFEDVDDLNARIDSAELPVDADSILVLKNGGPLGAPGFPELGTIPIPSKLLRQGITDVVRISDSRISGTSSGTIIVHVAPEAAAGGPLAVVRTGDEILLNATDNRLDLLVTPEELATRLSTWSPPPNLYERGYGKLFLDHVLQAPLGADFDFLTNPHGARAPLSPPLLTHGWSSL